MKQEENNNQELKDTPPSSVRYLQDGVYGDKILDTEQSENDTYRSEFDDKLFNKYSDRFV